MLDKNVTYDKWSKLGLLKGLDSGHTWKNQMLVTDEIEDNQDTPLLPIAMRIAAHTIAGGGWHQSEKQKLKQNRLNKLRQLQGEEPNVILPDDEFDHGLVSVQPLSAPSSHLCYIDFAYKSISEIYGPYNNKSEALSTINTTNRYIGLTIAIKSKNEPIEYWFKRGVEDINLIPRNKKRLRKEKLMELNKFNI